jgi:hypothetical protein
MARRRKMDSRLPPFAAVKDTVTGKPILIKRGESGYWPGKVMELHTDEDIERFNSERKVTPGMAEAMHFGSCFGWDVPGATLEAGEEMAARKAARNA